MTYIVKQKTPTMALCMDWETSGSTWGGDSSIDHQGISFGAVVFNTSTFEPVETLYCEIKFDATRYQWKEDAEKVHGISRERLEQFGVSQEDAAVALVEMLLKYFGPNPTIMFLGHNVEFDIAFTKQLLEQFGLMFAIHHVKLDTAGTGFITLGIFKSTLLFEAVGLEERKEHNALEDALYTLKTCQSIRMLVDAALSGTICD